LKLNDQNINDNYPFLLVNKNNNTEMVKLIIEYANHHKIILKINEMSKKKEYPLLLTTINNIIEIVKLIH